MKRVILIILIFVVIGGALGWVVTRHAANSVVSNISSPVSSGNPDTAAHTEKPHAGVPTNIVISKMSVDAEVEQVGLDEQKRMDVPKGVTNTGWYMYGPRPGEVGNAVIDGHFDTPTGAPSVFYDLAKLTPGDTIQITDDQQKIRTFVVDKTTSFPTDNFPIDRVFGNSDTAHLNLITCGGSWDRNKRIYDQRVVVFSHLQE
jgi:sortase (surface protein transpeptidase)